MYDLAEVTKWITTKIKDVEISYCLSNLKFLSNNHLPIFIQNIYEKPSSTIIESTVLDLWEDEITQGLLR